ncbi:GntP family permease [uncultured Anaerococcus sp.]|uniref:GntP family permease n=1 Tax=uncultured Anaerococcus sp. TaxID=293428 RepID=UPI002601ED72|nr:SLC13 family permease [uncultured Anaerococcus sp.]
MEGVEFSTLGAILGLIIAIILIIKNFHSTYSLILGALIGGIIGGGGLSGTVTAMIEGSAGMMSSVLRIMTSGILAGCLVKTGAAEKIADTIVNKLGEKNALISIAISTTIICAVGVFIDISVITTAPIALAVARRTKMSKSSALLAMIGGGKAGNIISPNPNTIATSEAFGLNLNSLMGANIIPAIVALIVTIILSKAMNKKFKDTVTDNDIDVLDSGSSNLPRFASAIAGPITVVILLALRPLFDIVIDPLVALPLGGIICLLACGEIKNISEYSAYGFSKVIGVCALLIGTGTLSGIISNSHLQTDMVNLIETLNLKPFVLAPISGLLMAAATASTTAGATIASKTFADTLISANVNSLNAAAMVHAGATILDSLPHGSFFHATGGSVKMAIKDRLKLIPYEAIVGLSSTITAIIIYLIRF